MRGKARESKKNSLENSLIFVFYFSNIPRWPLPQISQIFDGKLLLKRILEGSNTRIKENWCLQNSKLQNSSSIVLRKVSMRVRKTFYNFTFWGGKTLASKKSIFQYSHRFRRQWQWKQFFARLSLHFVLKMNSVIIFSLLFLSKKLLNIFACVMLSIKLAF